MHYKNRWPAGAVMTVLLFHCAAASADPVRISVAEFTLKQQQVKVLKKGMDAMRASSAADPMSQQFRTSLAYWANTHGYVGTGMHATSMQTYIIGYRMPQCLEAYGKATCDAYFKHVVNITVPADGYTDAIWGTCQHGNLYFLPWHRFFLHYFERTLRKHAKDPHFALPYWNYYDNYLPKRKGLALPGLVLKQKNTLYNQWRTPLLNTGGAVMDPDAADASQAFAFDDFTGFSNQLQGQPHGAMHCAAGSGCTAPDIGLVPIAGADPLFYMHHANIDRLWQCWMKKQAKGKTIDLAWAKANLGMPDAWYDQQFTFADENGQPVTVKVADVFSAAFTPQYDNLSDCHARPDAPAPPVPAGLKAMAVTPLQPHPPLLAGKKLELGNSAVDVPLQAAPAPPPEAVLKAAQAGGKTYLVLEDVRLQGTPFLTYKVYLYSKANPKQSSYVSTFSFFGAGAAHAGHGDGDALGTLVYQVSGNLHALGIKDASDVAVRFVPTDLMVGQKLKKQKPGSGVSVANIRLETAQATPAK